MGTTIKSVNAREVLDSRGNPTVEVEVSTESHLGRFIVPSGASTGQFEAVELRDNDSRFGGKGVLKAINNVNETINEKIRGRDVNDQEGLDNLLIELDGTSNKANLGANAILGVSIANLKAAAATNNEWIYEYIGKGSYSIPCPMLNVINGGEHAGGDLAIQEFMIMPLGFDTYKEGLRASVEVYQKLKKYLKDKYGGPAINVGDEGGFAPPLKKASEAMDALLDSIRNAGYDPVDHFSIGIDAAASEFFEGGKYHIDGLQLSTDEFVNYYFEWIENYPILLSIEDPFDENDFTSFSKLVKEKPSLSIVGDDLTVTNVERINTAIEHQAMNYLLLKVNQIGTFTEAKASFDLTKSQDWGVVISHRSGETEDTFIADLAVGLNAERIKTGAPARSERVAKYNQLLRIEEKLGEYAVYKNQR